MEPSDEAKAAAEKEYYNIALTMANTRLAHDYKLEVLAQMIDDQAAALRAEVGALRARVGELEAETSKEITVVEARLEAQRKRLTRWTKQTNDL